MINPALLDALRRKFSDSGGMPRMGNADTARVLLDSDDPTSESNHLMYGDAAARIMQPGGDPLRAMPTDGMTRLPVRTSSQPLSSDDWGANLGSSIGGAVGGRVAQKLDFPRMEGGSSMPMPQQAEGGWKSRLLHAGQGALMGLANARRNPTNPNDWGAVVGSAIGGGAAGAISPQSIENEKYYERDLPRWYEQQKMASDLSNKDRMQRMTEAQIENFKTDNERAQAEFEQKQTKFGQEQFEYWDSHDPKSSKALTAEEAARIGRPDLVGQLPSGGKRTGKSTGRETLNTSEGIIERMPNGGWEPVMSRDTRTNPVQSAAFSGIQTGEAPHQLQAPSTARAAAPHFSQDGRQMWDGSKWVQAPGYASAPEKPETANERSIRERQDIREERDNRREWNQKTGAAETALKQAQAKIDLARKISSGPNSTPEQIRQAWDNATSDADQAISSHPELLEPGPRQGGFADIRWKGGKRPAYQGTTKTARQSGGSVKKEFQSADVPAFAKEYFNGDESKAREYLQGQKYIIK